MAMRKRQGQNRIFASEDLSNATYWSLSGGVVATTPSADVAPPVAGMQVSKVVYDGSGGAGALLINQDTTVIPKRSVPQVATIWLRTLSGTVNLRLRVSVGVTTPITVTSTWQPFSSVDNSTGSVGMQIYSESGLHPAFTVYATGAQVEQSDAPGDYVKTTTSIFNVSAPMRKRLPQNFFTRDNDYTDAVWAKQSTTPLKNVAGPDGVANSACTLTDSVDGASVGHFVAQNAAVAVAGAAYTCWVDAKAGTKSIIAIIPGAGTWQVTFDLAAGAVGQSLNVAVAASLIRPLGNGWYRCSVTYIPTAAQLGLIQTGGNRLYIAGGLGVVNYQGDGTGTVILGDAGIAQTDATPDLVRTGATAVPQAMGLPRMRTGQNLFQASQAFDNAAWTKEAGVTVVADAVAAPDGTMTADTIVGVTNAAGVYQRSTGFGPGSAARSVWLRSVSGTVALNVQGPDGGEPIKAVVLTTTWQRFSSNGPNPSVSLNRAGIYLVGTNVGAAGSFYAWGGQLEQSNAPGDYVPTTTAAYNPSGAPASKRTAA